MCNIEWGSFAISDIFNIATGRDVIIGKVENGEIPLISHQHDNNGITKYINKLADRRLFDYESTISLADRGVFYATTQNQDFHIGTRVKSLVFKTGKQSENIRLFVTSAINKLQVLFTTYSDNATNKLPNLEIRLPMKNGEIDFDLMNTAIRAVKKLVIADVVKYADREMAAYERVIQ